MVDTSFVSATLYHKGLGKSSGIAKFLGERRIFSEFRLYAIVNERGSSVIAFHLLPHSETVLQGRENGIYKMFIILCRCNLQLELCLSIRCL